MKLDINKSRLFLDLDGCMADFMTGLHDFYEDPMVTLDQLRKDPIERSRRINKIIEDGLSERFFRNLTLESNAYKIIDWLIQHPQVQWSILSRPFDGNGVLGSISGKEQWLEYYGLHKAPAIFTADKHLHACVDMNTPNVLVDDHHKNISKWEFCGGIGILHRNDSIDTTILALNELFEK